MTRPRILYELSEPDLTVLPGIEAIFALPEITIASGDRVEVELNVRNVSDDEISFQTDRPLTALVVLPGTRSVVGATGGPMIGTGLGVRLYPGGTDRIPVIVAAWGHGTVKELSGTHTYLHEGLPPGRYGLIVRVPIYGQESAYQQQELWSQESSILVTEPTP